MTFRKLGSSEWDLAVSLFKQHFNEMPPHEGSSVVIIAEDEGKVVGLLTAQLTLHVEPLWVDKAYRGRWVVPQLINELKRVIPGIWHAFAHCEDSRVGKLLEKLGMEKLPWTMYRWLKKEK